MQLAELILRARTDDLRRARGDLDDLRNTGARTEQGITGSMGKVSQGFSSAAIAASKFAAGAAAAVAASVSIGQAVSVIRQFETSMSQVAAITGATGVELSALRDVAKELGSTTEFSAAQAADGLKFLGMAGFNAAESIAAIPAVLDLATASAMDLASAADISSNVLSGFGMAAGDAAQVADVLAFAASNANTSVQQLGGAMSTAAPIAAALGIDLQDTAAAIGVMSDAGIQGERAGTALRGVLASLAGPTDAAADALSKYGLTAAQVNPESVALADIFATLRDRGLSTADAMTIFGREAASGALVLTEAAGRVGEFGDELRGAEGAAADMAGIMRDNLAGSANSALSALQGLALAIGEAGLTAVLRAGLDGATALVRGLTRLVEIGGSVIDWVTSFGTFETTLRNVQAASDTANLAIADTLAQVNALSVAEMGGRQVSLDYAGAKLEQARASYAAAEAIREERIEQIMAGDEYQSLIAKQIQLNDNIAMIQDILSESPSKAALDMMEFMRDPTDPDNLDGFTVQLERSLEKLRATVAQQQLLTGTVGETNEEMQAALRQIGLYEAAIAAAKDGTVVLGAETSNAADTTAALARLAGQVDFGNAVSSAQSLADWLGISLSRAMALAATTPAMADEDLLMSQGVIPDANARAAQREAVENFNRMSAAMNRVGGSARSAGKAVSDAEKEVEKLNDEIQRLEESADPAKKFRREMEQLDKLLANGLSDGAYRKAVEDLNEELVNSTPILSDLNSAFGDFVDYAFDGFKDGMAGIWDIFKRTLTNMIATAAKSRITFGIGMVATGGAGAAAAGQPGGILSGAGGISNMLGGLWGTASAPGLFGGAGLLGMGGGTGILGLGAGSGLATTLGGGAFGAAASIALPVIGVGLALGALFKKTEVVVANGVRARIDGAMLELDSYEKTKKDNMFGMSSGFSRDFDRMDDEVQSAVQARLNATIASLEAFGLGTDLTGFSFSKRTEIKDGETFEGESEEVIREALSAAIEYATDGALDAFTRSGEDMAGTLERLVTSLNSVNPIVDMLGDNILPLSLDGAAAASALADLAGGLEAFGGKAAFVFENFLTDQERLNFATQQLNATFGAMSVALPETHAQFRALMEAQDLSTEAGRQLYTALLDVAPLFVEVKGTAQDAAGALAEVAAQNSAVTSAMSDLRAAIAAEVSPLQDQLRVAQDAMRESESVANALRNALRNMRTESQRSRVRASAQATLSNMLSAGRVTDTEAFRDALSVVQEPSENLFGSFVEYQRDFYRTANLISSLETKADRQLSADQRTASGIETQISQLNALIGQYDTQISATMSVANAVRSLEDALTAQQEAAAMAASPASREDAYLAANPDVAAAVAAGMFSSGAEHFALHGQFEDRPAFANGGMHSGGMRLVGERGPELEVTGPSRIYSASQTKQMMHDDVLRKEVREMKEYIRELVKINNKQERTLKEIEIQGETA